MSKLMEEIEKLKCEQVIEKIQFVPEFNGTNVPIDVVAQAFKKDRIFIRYAILNGLLPIGFAFKREGSSQYGYYISPKLLYEYSGFIYEKALVNCDKKEK